MRKIVSIMFLLTTVLCFISCGLGHSKLRNFVEQLNKEMPKSYGIMGVALSWQYEDGNVIVNYKINENFVDIDGIRENPELFKESAKILCNDMKNDYGAKKLLTMMDECDAGLVLHYIGNKTGKEVYVTLSSEEVKSALKSDNEYSPLALLEQEIKVTNVHMPLNVENGVVVKNLVLDDDMVVYNVIMDESLYSIAALRSNEMSLRDNLRSNISNNDPGMVRFIQICKKANVAIAYKYIGDTSGDSFLVRFECDEL